MRREPRSIERMTTAIAFTALALAIVWLAMALAVIHPNENR